ncbi:AAA family ATPase [Xanthobacteraceae bacterium A53D]
MPDAPRIVISGCSGGGKSTLLAELARRGHMVVPEPGRRIVAQEQASGGTALPWVDMAAFARRALALALSDYAQTLEHPRPVFFDRGAVDAVVALAHAGNLPFAGLLPLLPRYSPRVFMAPPWPELHAPDAERQLDFTAAQAEYDRLVQAYPEAGYTLTPLPKTSVSARADFLLAKLAADREV